ncbi:MAG: alpha/beta hydrolase domain-containing protein [Halioglobus sp.]
MPPLQAVFTKFKVTGPILPDSGLSLGTGGQDLALVGYQRKEFFLTGTANSYTPALPLPDDGKLVVTPDPDTLDGSYKTRLVVIRPVDPARFNGTVIVEWLNVTAGADVPPDWIMAHNEFIRSGYAWVGVSAQAVGVNALKTGSTTAVRYASLLHPGDSYSYSIFSHAGIRAGESASKLLGGLTADRVIAAGESQSASRMVTYIDAIQPLDHVFDGFFVHSRSGSGSSISQAPLTAYSFPAPAPILDDLDVPVMLVQAEGDVINSNLAARQPDTSMFRAWEMAGTSHADAYTLEGLNDPGDGSAAITMFGYMRNPPNPFSCTSPINAGGHHWIVQAAFHALDTWVRTLQDPLLADLAPPQGTPLEIISDTPVVLARDLQGNALGGVRSPHVDAPVATLDSENSGVFFCRLFGRTTPLTADQIVNLYPTKTDFITQWSDAIDVGVANGFLLPADVAELNAAANAWNFPN